MTRWIARALVPLAFAAAAASVAVPAQAADPGVQCGQTITGAVHLDADLHCTGDGVTLAPGASLDLGGHTMSGPGRATAVTVPTAGHVAVSNGTLRDWGGGIVNVLDKAYPGTVSVSQMTFIHDYYAIESNGSIDQTAHINFDISDSVFVRNGYGIFADYTRMTVRRSYFKSGHAVVRPGYSVGVSAYESTIQIINSIFQSVPTGIECLDSSCSITSSVLRDGTQGLTVSNNPQVSVRVTVSSSRFTRLSTGVYASDSPNPLSVADNHFLQDGVGVSAQHAQLEMTGNDVREGTTGLSYAVSLSGAKSNALIADNVFAANHDGVLLTNEHPPSAAMPVVLRANAADDNTDYGIYAPGVTDGGGNTASGNGHDPQCVGVVCS